MIQKNEPEENFRFICFYMVTPSSKKGWSFSVWWLCLMVGVSVSVLPYGCFRVSQGIFGWLMSVANPFGLSVN